MKRAALTMAILVGLACTAHAAPPVLDRKQQLLVDVYVQTRTCMRSAGRAAHARNNNPRDVQYFMVAVCSSALMRFLREDMSEDEAQQFLLRITRTTFYEDVLGIPEPY